MKKYRYIVVIDLRWMDKDIKSVRIPMVNEIKMIVNENSNVQVVVLPLEYIKTFEYRNGEITEDNIKNELLKIVIEDIMRMMRRKLKKSLKRVSFDTLKMEVAYVKGGLIDE